MVSLLTKFAMIGLVLWNVTIQKVQPRHEPISCHWALSIPPENIRKPKIFWCFQGVSKETSGMKWVTLLSKSSLIIFSKFSELQIIRTTEYLLHHGIVWTSTSLSLHVSDKLLYINNLVHIALNGHSHCVKNGQIRSYFWSVFSCIRTEYVFSPNTRKYGPEKTQYLDTFQVAPVNEKENGNKWNKVAFCHRK